MHTWLAVLFVMLAAASASAQALPIDRLTPALPTSGERNAADIASWATVLSDVALDAKASWDNPRRLHAFEWQGARLGVTYGLAAVIKALVRRSRPCAPDCGIDAADASFYSMHTAMAFETLGGPRLAVALPLAVGTGGLRIAARKHWLTDVLTGAGIGALTSRMH